MRRFVAILLVVLWQSFPVVAADKPYLAGRMLVAAPTLSDPYFQWSVVYLVEHNAEGAFGVIVNRKMGEGPLAELIGDHGFDVPEEMMVPLYFGGPVDMRKLFVLHSGEYEGIGTQTSPGGISMTGHRSIYQDILEGKGPKRHRLFLGYAGWGAGQLEGEIQRGDWFDADPDETVIFEPVDDQQKSWLRAREKAGLTL